MTSNKPTWPSGDYTGTMRIGKDPEQKFNCQLHFNRGSVKGQASESAGGFRIEGTYNTVPPYRNGFGMDHFTVKGMYSTHNEILGTWYPFGGQAPGGDLYFCFKPLSPEERKKAELESRTKDLHTLMSMGFDEWACELALETVQGNVDAKIEWLLNGNHLGADPDAKPSSQSSQKPQQAQNSGGDFEASLAQIVAMGFPRGEAVAALESCGNDAEQALAVLLSNLD